MYKYIYTHTYNCRIKISVSRASPKKSSQWNSCFMLLRCSVLIGIKALGQN